MRGLAATIKATLQMGKDGLTETFTEELKAALERDELVKVSVNKTSPMGVKEAAESCATESESALVQIIGRKLVLYKRSEENPVIVLPE